MIPKNTNLLRTYYGSGTTLEQRTDIRGGGEWPQHAYGGLWKEKNTSALRIVVPNKVIS